MTKTWIAAAAVLAMMTGSAFAQTTTSSTTSTEFDDCGARSGGRHRHCKQYSAEHRQQRRSDRQDADLLERYHGYAVG